MINQETPRRSLRWGVRGTKQGRHVSAGDFSDGAASGLYCWNCFYLAVMPREPWGQVVR